MQGKGTDPSDFFLFRYTTKRDLYKEAHVKSYLQLTKLTKLTDQSQLVLFCSSTLAVCVLAVSRLSPPLLITQTSAGICWSYHSCFFHRTAWLCLGFLVLSLPCSERLCWLGDLYHRYSQCKGDVRPCLQHTCGFRLFKAGCIFTLNSSSFRGSSGIGRMWKAVWISYWLV